MINLPALTSFSLPRKFKDITFQTAFITGIFDKNLETLIILKCSYLLLFLFPFSPPKVLYQYRHNIAPLTIQYFPPDTLLPICFRKL